MEASRRFEIGDIIKCVDTELNTTENYHGLNHYMEEYINQYKTFEVLEVSQLGRRQVIRTIKIIDTDEIVKGYVWCSDDFELSSKLYKRNTL
jgi:hypothetical protein